MANTMRKVAAVGTMAAAGVGVLAGTASASPTNHPTPHPPKQHCHVEWKKTWERGHWVPGHWVHGHWVRHNGHQHWVHGYRTQGHWEHGHKVYKPEVVCDVWGPGGWHHGRH